MLINIDELDIQNKQLIGTKCCYIQRTKLDINEVENTFRYGNPAGIIELQYPDEEHRGKLFTTPAGYSKYSPLHQENRQNIYKAISDSDIIQHALKIRQEPENKFDNKALKLLLDIELLQSERGLRRQERVTDTIDLGYICHPLNLLLYKIIDETPKIFVHGQILTWIKTANNKFTIPIIQIAYKQSKHSTIESNRFLALLDQ